MTGGKDILPLLKKASLAASIIDDVIDELSFSEDTSPRNVAANDSTVRRGISMSPIAFAEVAESKTRFFPSTIAYLSIVFCCCGPCLRCGFTLDTFAEDWPA
jgi:hypothetical protein